MTQLKKQKVFTVVKVGDEMPPLKQRVSISMDGGITFPYEAVGKDWKPEEVSYTHWLKEGEKYVFDDESLIELLFDFHRNSWSEAKNTTLTMRESFQRSLESKELSVKEQIKS